MTREEIKELKGLAASMGLYDDKYPCKRAVILGKAIEALEREPCNDAISRAKTIDEVSRIMLDHPLDGYEDGQLILKIIQDMPPVTPTKKVGQWIYIGNKDINQSVKIVECNVCHKRNMGSSDYCPSCGVKMQEVEE